MQPSPAPAAGRPGSQLAYFQKLLGDFEIETLRWPDTIGMTNAPIGSGASFEVEATEVPSYVRELGPYRTIYRDGSQRKTFKIGDVVVLKRAKVPIESLEGPEDGFSTGLSAICLELRALSHPSLRGHPYIVDLYGVFWRTQEDEFQRLTYPVLVMEYANRGSLDKVLRNEKLTWETKMGICSNVAMALDALHKCNLAHGDVKPENVLIFQSDGEERLIAKLGDFGFSFETNPEVRIAVGGTRRWIAPELYDEFVSGNMFRKTDIYSYGLLVLTLIMDGVDPFSKLRQGRRIADLHNELQEIEALKRREDFSKMVKDLARQYIPATIDSNQLMTIFDMTLGKNPHSRCENLCEVLPYLLPQEAQSASNENDESPLSKLVDFKLPSNTTTNATTIKKKDSVQWLCVGGGVAEHREDTSCSFWLFQFDELDVSASSKLTDLPDPRGL